MYQCKPVCNPYTYVRQGVTGATGATGATGPSGAIQAFEVAAFVPAARQVIIPPGECIIINPYSGTYPGFGINGPLNAASGIYTVPVTGAYDTTASALIAFIQSVGQPAVLNLVLNRSGVEYRLIGQPIFPPDNEPVPASGIVNQNILANTGDQIYASLCNPLPVTGDPVQDAANTLIIQLLGQSTDPAGNTYEPTTLSIHRFR
jgi:hypothetical protein